MNKFAILLALAVAAPAFADATQQKPTQKKPAQKKPVLQKSGGFELFAGEDKQFYACLRAANRQVILLSEGYSDKGGAQKGIEAIKTASCEKSHFKISRAVTQKGTPARWYFVLKAENHETVGVSELYNSRQGAEKGVASVMANGCGSKGSAAQQGAAQQNQASQTDQANQANQQGE